MHRRPIYLVIALVTVLLLSAGAGMPGVRGETKSAPLPAEGGISATHRLEIDGSSASGVLVDLESLQIYTEVIEYKDGDDPILRKRPGQNHIADVMITCIDDCPAIYDWFLTVVNLRIERHPMSLRFLDANGSLTGDRWFFYECWPNQLQGSLSDDGALYHNRFQITCEVAGFAYSGVVTPW